MKIEAIDTNSLAHTKWIASTYSVCKDTYLFILITTIKIQQSNHRPKDILFS